MVPLGILRRFILGTAGGSVDVPDRDGTEWIGPGVDR